MDRKTAAAAFEHNKRLEKRAFEIVNILIDVVNENTLLKNLNAITKQHYDDVIDERAISNMCAYPICSQLLPVVLPQQLYTIRTHSNKIYSLVDRKKYCCDFCYEANLFVRNQIPDSPLWWRENEPLPSFELLSPDKKVGLVGQELDITKLNLDDGKGDKADKKIRKVPKRDKAFELDAIKEESLCDSTDESDVSETDGRDLKPIAVPITTGIAPPFVYDQNLQSKIEHVERCFREWFTLESLLEIFDATVIREKYGRAIARNCAIAEPGSKLNNLKTICKRLGLTDSANDTDFEKNFKKVRAFFGIETRADDGDEADDGTVVLPLLDRVAQNAIRKNIFLQSMNAAIRTICPIFDASLADVQTFLVVLAKTFNLTAKNVTFNAKVTKYVGLLVLKVYAKKNHDLAHQLDQQVHKQINILNEIDKSLESCESFLSNLFDFQ